MSDLADPGCTASDDRWEDDDEAPDLGTAVMGPVPAGKRVGFNTRLGLWESGVTPEQEAALIRRVGGTLQRFPLQWRGIQPQGPGPLGNLDGVDTQYRRLLEAGVEPVVGLVGAPAWAACKPLALACRSRVARERNVPPMWDYIDEYASVEARIAQRYPNAVIETWNEPNHTSFWEDDQFPDPARMARMQCAAYNAIKRVRPDQRVSSPGLAWIEARRTSDGRGAGLLEYLRQMYVRMGRVCWDVLSVHVYPALNYDGPDSRPAKLLRLLRNLRTQYGDASPVWISELGASTSGDGRFSEAQQETIVNTALGELLAAPEVEAVLVHTLRDRPQEDDRPAAEQYGFGLLREGAGPFPAPKPAYCALVARAGNTYPGC